MSAYITEDVMKFVGKAAKAFEDNPMWETYISDRDCIKVYEIGDEIGLFAQWIKR
jgi:hypothetical protein